MAAASPDRDALLAVLDFYVAAGIDLALDEAPHDRFAETDGPESAPAPLSRPARAETPPSRGPELREASGASASFAAPLPRAATAPMEEIAADARERAGTAATLAALETIVAAFDGCALKASARQLVFADGAPGSRLMLLGEAPGAEEDRTGRPFVGRAGQLLDRMLDAIGLARGDVYVANVVPWRPPGNRAPTPQEVAICLPFTLRQIELAAPSVVVTLGAPATQMLLGTKETLFRLRGRWFDKEVGSARVRVLPMLHPADLLRHPLHKRLAWRDLLLLQRELAATKREP